MSGRSLHLGVDGGGSKTDFVCLDDELRVVARAASGGTYHLQIGVDGVIDRLREGIDTICRELGAAPADLTYSFLGLPAFGEDKRVDPQLDRAIGAVLGHDRYRCGNDMISGWAGSLACEDGINLVAGTGSIGYGERRGRSARCGGWGEVFGDEGSAYWIGIEGLRAFSRMSDGRLPTGPLHGLLKEALDLDDDLDLCACVMGEHGMARDAIAGLARIVSQAATGGDRAAAAILDAAADELFAIAEALRATLGFEAGEQVQLSWSGGVLVNEPRVSAALARRLDRSGVYRTVEARHPPGYGAALYAAHLWRARTDA